MKQYTAEKIKNIVMLGHAGSGKTSTAEAMLFDSGATQRMGSVVEGNTVTDFDAEEIKRKNSVRLSLAPFEYKDYKVNLIDVPGFADFVGEAISGISAADSAIFVACAVTGLGVGAHEFWRLADEKNLPRIIFINKMDKERADYYTTLDVLRESFGKDVVPVYIPIGKEASFSGVVDVLNKKAYKFENGKSSEIPIPEDMNGPVEKYRDMLIEEVVEIDEALLEKFMNNEEISDAQIAEAFQKSVDHKQIYPVLCGSAAKNIGINLLAEAAEHWLPGADEIKLQGLDGSERKPAKDEAFSGYIFSTMIEPHVGELSFVRVLSGALNHSSSVYNSSKNTSERVGQLFFLRGKNREETQSATAGDIVALPKLKSTATGDTLCDQNRQIVYRPAAYPEPILSIAVKPKSKADQEKMGTALNSLTHEDPTFKVSHNIETKETIISGMGDVHLEVMLERVKKRFGVEIEAGAPRIPYRETIRGKAKGQGKYKKQSGGRGQYGDCWLDIEPLPRGRGFVFVDKIVGGAIPKNYIPSIEKGIKETMITGVIAGYQVMDVKITLCDGSYHEVDSSDMAFKIAGSMGFKKTFNDAIPIILEPIMNLEINVPDDCVGDIVSDINKRRGKILGMDQAASKHTIVKTTVPFAEASKYASDLRSISRGRGYFSSKFSHYEEAPAKTQQELRTKYEQLKAAGELREMA
ncbi:MAG: elongation factor G [Candidatus Saganbacteria bacterium]|nr:elongation factor G [Candidatus Saganbacteria bacterium]